MNIELLKKDLTNNNWSILQKLFTDTVKQAYALSLTVTSCKPKVIYFHPVPQTTASQQRDVLSVELVQNVAERQVNSSSYLPMQWTIQ